MKIIFLRDMGQTYISKLKKKKDLRELSRYFKQNVHFYLLL